MIDVSLLRIGKRAGAGGSGQVFHGTLSGSPVAVKELYSALIEPSYTDEFRREAAFLARLHHPCIVQFYGACRIEEGRDGIPHLFLVMELCHSSLRNLLSMHQLLESPLHLHLNEHFLDADAHGHEMHRLQ